MEGLEAKIRLIPPKEKGKPPRREDVISTLKEKGIIYGVDEKVIDSAILKKEYNKVIVVAKAKKPTKGIDASYIYKYEEEIEVIDGQILAIKEEARLGEPGISVFGKEIPGISGDDFQIIPGKNTYLSEDGKILYSTGKGKVFWKENRADVLKVLRIDGDLAEDVDFDGMVIISGNISPDVSLKAEDIKVGGEIKNGVSIVSRGTIEVEKDIMGSEEKRVSIKAECDCLANSASYSDIEAGGSIVMKTGLLHSNTRAENCVVIGRKAIIMTFKDIPSEIFSLPIAMAKGVQGIIGGVIQGKNSVSAETIGSVSYEKTEIIVDQGGFVSSMSIYPKTKITIGKTSLEVKKAMESLTLKEERGGILQFPYQQKEVKLKTKEYEQRKPESEPSILVKNIEEGKRLLGIADIDYIPLKNWFLCFERQRKGAWEKIREEKKEERRKEEERDGEIEILNQEDGLFVVIKPPGRRGNPVTLEDAKEKLKEFYDYNENTLKITIEEMSSKPVKIGPRQYIPELDGKVVIRTNENKEAYIGLTPPHPHLGKPIRGRIVLREIEKNNITFGIDKNAIASLLKNPVYNKEIPFAKAKMPSKGKDAYLIYQFGIVEGKEIKREDCLEVIEGQILAIKEPSKIGEKGIDIFGEEIEGIIGDDIEIIPGAGTYLSAEGRILYSHERGEAHWKENRCDVEKVLRIEGDCKEDVDFPGKVIISGNVEKRTNIIAKGDIVVKGMVEMGANLTSNGSIYIDKNVVGKKKEEVFLKASGDIVCESCEMTNISTDGILIVRIFLDGIVKAKRVFIQGRRGIIMTKGEVPPPIFTLPVVIAKGKKTFEGAKIFAEELVDTEEMGSSEMTETEVEVGEKGIVSISGTIFPNSKIKIGIKTLRITKPLIGLTFKLKDGQIKESPYESSPIEMTKKEIVSKKMRFEPPASIVITDQNLLDAIARGAHFLKIPEEKAEFSLLLEEKPNKTIRIFPAGMFGPWSEDWDATYGEDRDARFSFDNRADGLYLVIHPPHGEGRWVVHNDVLQGIKKEGFVGIDYVGISNLFKEIEEKKERKERAIKIGERQYLSDVSKIIKIKITEDEKAEAIFYPPMIGGMLIDMDEVMKFINNEGIIAGIDHNAIKDALVNERFKEPIVIASPIPPIQGKDALLEYKVKEKEGISLSPDVSGRVDFKETSLIVSVKKGDILVVKHPPIPGKPGKKISGEEILPPPPKDIPLPVGKNTKISDDGLFLIADIDGKVIFKEKKIDLEPLYEVRGDVCLQTGNIHFSGSVIISGSVLPGFVVSAEADVFIKDAIDGGIIKAGGKIEVQGGIRKGNVAGKTITASFIENSYISCEDVAVKGAILHSDILTFNIKAKKIMGGRIFAKNSIEADEIKGKTSLYLGREPEIILQIEELTKSLKEAKVEYERLLLDIAHIDLLSSHRKELLKEEIERKRKLLFEAIEKIRDLETKEKNEGAFVRVKNTISEGTEIDILKSSFFVLEEKRNCTIRLKNGRIVIEI
ncbi:MAG: FapA family protein [bacterium]